MKNVHINQPPTTDLFYLTVSIYNLEFKLGKKLSIEHPWYKKKLELINNLSERGLNVGDITNIDKEAIKYIDKHN